MIIAIGLTGAQAQTTDSSVEGMLEVVRSVNLRVRESLGTNPGCAEIALSNLKASGTCNMADICKSLEKNAMSEKVYESADGGYIPNYGLNRLDITMMNCLDDIERSRPFNAELTRRATVARNKFLEILAKNAEEATHVALEIASNRKILESFDQPSNLGSGGMGLPPDPDAMDAANLTELERLAGRSFSQETRIAYLDMLRTQRELYGSPIEMPVARHWQKTTRNPFINYELFSSATLAGGDEALKRNQEEFNTRSARARRIFEDSKTRIVAYLEKKKTDTNRAIIDNLITRVKTVHAEIPNWQEPLRSLCEHKAFYTRYNHRVTFCPDNLVLPEAALRDLIYHEIGHALDPCIADNNLFELEPPPGVTDAKIFSAHNGPINPQMGAGRKIADRIAIDAHPFKNVMLSCLATDKSVNARVEGRSQGLATLNRRVEGRRRAGTLATSAEQAATITEQQEYLFGERGNNLCSTYKGPEGYNQMQDAFADWLAAEVVGEDIRMAAEKDRARLAFESMLFNASLVCPAVHESAEDRVREELKDLKCPSLEPSRSNALDRDFDRRMKAFEREISDEHPLNIDRAEKIFLVQPNIARGLGCAPNSGARYCE